MSDRPGPGPDWLAALQQRFGDALRAPLDRQGPTLRARTEEYPSDTLADLRDGPAQPASARLAVYHRQYWFRLFTVMQSAFAVTARLLGYWRFNGHAADFLSACPPRGWDLDAVPDGFERHFVDAVREDPARDLLAEAAALDAAFRSLLRAHPASPLALRPNDAAGLLDARLVPSPSVIVLSERWPLLEQRAVIIATPGEGAVRPPDALDAPRAWALVRERDGVRHLSLEPLEAALLALLRDFTVREALARLEARCPAPSRAALPASAQRWLARGVHAGLWSGVEAPSDQ